MGFAATDTGTWKLDRGAWLPSGSCGCSGCGGSCDGDCGGGCGGCSGTCTGESFQLPNPDGGSWTSSELSQDVAEPLPIIAAPAWPPEGGGGWGPGANAPWETTLPSLDGGPPNAPRGGGGGGGAGCGEPPDCHKWEVKQYKSASKEQRKKAGAGPGTAPGDLICIPVWDDTKCSKHIPQAPQKPGGGQPGAVVGGSKDFGGSGLVDRRPPLTGIHVDPVDRVKDGPFEPEGGGYLQTFFQPTGGGNDYPGTVVPQQTKEEEKCGPDVTDWFRNELKKHFKKGLSIRKKGVLGALMWVGKNGMKIQYKSMDFSGPDCPKGEKCKNTVWFHKRCMDRSELGNIVLGLWVSMAGISQRMYLVGVNKIGKERPGEGMDDVADAASLALGYELGDSMFGSKGFVPNQAWLDDPKQFSDMMDSMKGIKNKDTKTDPKTKKEKMKKYFGTTPNADTLISGWEDIWKGMAVKCPKCTTKDGKPAKPWKGKPHPPIK